MRPVFRTCHQAGSHWILPDVIGLELKTFIRPDPMIEVVALPAYLRAAGRETLPIADDLRHALILGKSGYHVEMIGHEQENVQNPMPPLVIEYGVRYQSGRSDRCTELILSTQSATNRDEEPGITHRGRRDVLQCFA